MEDWKNCVKILTSKPINKSIDEEDILFIAKIISKYGGEVLKHDTKYECFYSALVALCAHYLYGAADRLSKQHFETVLDASKIIQEFVHARLIEYDVQCVIHQNNLVQIIYVLCQKSKEIFLKSDIITFIAMLKTAKIPESEKKTDENDVCGLFDVNKLQATYRLAAYGETTVSETIDIDNLIKENLAFLKQLSSRFKLLNVVKSLPYLKRYINRVSDLQKGKPIMLPNIESNALIVKNGLGPLASNIIAAYKIVQLPIVSYKLEESDLELLHMLDLSCMLAGVSILTALAVCNNGKAPAGSEVMETESIEEQTAANTDGRAIGALTINSILAIHKIIESTLGYDGTRSNNKFFISVLQILSKGLATAYCCNSVLQSQLEETYPNYRSLDLLSIRFDQELCQSLHQIFDKTKVYASDNIFQEIFSDKPNSAEQTLNYLIDSVYSLFMLMLSDAADPKVSSDILKPQDTALIDLNAQLEDEFLDTASNESGENMFGELFKQSPAGSVDSGLTEKKEREDADNIPLDEKEYLKVIDVNQKDLTSHFQQLIKCIRLIILDENAVVQNFVQEKITSSSLEKLITMIKILDKRDFMSVETTSTLMSLMHAVIENQSLRVKLETVFKIDPITFLYMKPKMLSISFQILFQKQCFGSKVGEEDVVSICDELILTIKNELNEPTYSGIVEIPVEVFQACLFFFHTFTEEKKANFMCLVIKSLAEITEPVESPVAVSRLLAVFDYLLLHYVQPDAKIVDHVMSNMVAFHRNPPQNDDKNTYNELYRQHKKFTAIIDKTEESSTLKPSDEVQDLFYILSDERKLSVCEKLLDDVKTLGIDLIQILNRCLCVDVQLSKLVETNKAENYGLLIQRFVAYCFTMAKNGLSYFDPDATAITNPEASVLINLINLDKKKLEPNELCENLEKLFTSFSVEFLNSISMEYTDWIQSFSPFTLMALDCILAETEILVWNATVNISKERLQKNVLLGFELLNFFSQFSRNLCLHHAKLDKDRDLFNLVMKLGSSKLNAFLDEPGQNSQRISELLNGELKKLTEIQEWDPTARKRYTNEYEKTNITKYMQIYLKLLECDLYNIMNYIQVFLPVLFEFTSTMLAKLIDVSDETKDEVLSEFETKILPLQLDSIMSLYFHNYFDFDILEGVEKGNEKQSRSNIKQSVMLYTISNVLQFWELFNTASITESNKAVVLKLQIEYIKMFKNLVGNSDFCIALQHYVKGSKELDLYKGIILHMEGSFVSVFEKTKVSEDPALTLVIVELLCEMFSQAVDNAANKQMTNVMDGFNKSPNNIALVNLFTVPINQEFCNSKVETWLYKIARCLSQLDSPICVELVKSTKESVSSKLTDKSVTTLVNILIILACANGGAGHYDLFKLVLQWIKSCKSALKKAETPSEKIETLKSVYEFLLCYVMNVLSSALGSKAESEFSDVEDDTILVEDILANDSSAALMEDDSNDIDPICFSVCTYTITQKEFMNQHWYHCHTCGMIDGVGVCTICAKVCHKNHDLSYAKFGSFFCDCGAKEDKSCKAMQPREPCTASSKEENKQASTSTSASKLLTEANATQSSQMLNAFQEKKLKDKRKMALKVTNSIGPLLKFLSSDAGKAEVGNLLLSIAKDTQALYYNSEFNILDESGLGYAAKIFEKLHTSVKTLKVVDDLMIPTLGSQEGAFENVKANYTGDQGQTIRQLIHARVIRRVGMCCLTNPSGRKHHLAVTHEKNKITMLQLSSLLKEADAKKRKLTLTRLSTSTVPFNIVTMSSNPCNEEVLSVCGLKDCHVIRYSSVGTTQEQLALHPQLSTGNCISKSVWIPGSKSQLALVTADFVKIYDLSKDVLSPEYYFLLPTGKIRDATFIVPYQKGKSTPCLVVMSSLGYLYTQQLNAESSATNGPFYMTNVLNAEYPTLSEKNGQMGGGGVSVYYSHGLQLLFFSYHSPNNFAAALNTGYDEITKLFPIVFKSGTKNGDSDTCLFDWSEISGHPGLMTCFTHTTNQPVVLMIEPDSIHLQEIKLVVSTSSKAKMQDVIAIRHSGTSELNDKTTLIVLCEDGSLRIFLANATSTKFWLQTSLQPRSIFDRVAHAQKLKMAKIEKLENNSASALKSSSTDFAIDYFENCQLINLSDIEFGGNDLLYVYNKAQIKNRLNNTSMYIMSTKAFSIEITNKSKNQVITGVRVQLGGKGSDAVPTTMSFGNREFNFGPKLQKSRWFDVPLTREEIMKYGTKLVLRFFGSEHPEEYTIVDSIKVYGKSKESFGWAEEEKQNAAGQEKAESKPEAILSQESIGQASNISSASDYLCTSIDEISSHQDNIILTVYMSLNCLISAAAIGKFSDEFCGDVKATVSSLLVKTIPSPIYGLLKSLLTKVFSKKNDYYKFKDSLIMSTIFNMLESKQNSIDIPWVSEELFQKFVAELDTIAVRRPENLITVSDKDSLSLRIMDLVKIFFDILAIKPENKFLAPSCLPGLTHIKATVRTLVEVMFTTALIKDEATPEFCKVWIKLLRTSEYSVNCYAASTLEKLLFSQGCNEISEKANMIGSRSSEGSAASSRSASPQPTQSNSTISAPTGTDNLGFASQQMYSESQDDENEDDDEDEDDDDEDDSDGDEFEDIGPDDMEIDHDVLTETMENVIELGSSVLDREEQLIAMHAQEQQDATNNNAPAEEMEQEMEIVVDETGQDNFQGEASQEESLDVDFNELGIDDQSMINYAIALSLQDQSAEGNDSFINKDKNIATDKSGKEKVLSEKEQHRASQTLCIRLAFVDVLIDGIPDVLKDLIWEHAIPYFDLVVKLSTCLNTTIPEHTLILKKLVTLLLNYLNLNRSTSEDMNESMDSDVKNIIISESLTSLFIHDTLAGLSENFLACYVAQIFEDTETPQKIFHQLKYLLNNYWEKHITKQKTKMNEQLNVLKISSPMFANFKSPLIDNLPKSIGSKDEYFVNFTVVLLRLLYRYHQVQKGREDGFTFPVENINVLHNYIMQIEKPIVKKRTRKLLLELAGSREKYREQRDYHLLIMNLKGCVAVYSQTYAHLNIGYSYKTMKALVGKLTVCLSIAKKRTLNWQNYCINNSDCLNLLMNMSVAVGEHIAVIALEMLQLAFNAGRRLSTGQPKPSDVKKISPKEEKSSSFDKKVTQNQIKMANNAETLTKLMLETTPENSLRTFFQHFLLKENSSSVRWSTHQLLLTLFQNVKDEWGKKLVSILWKLWPSVPLYGRKASQFIDILGYFTLTVQHSEKELIEYIDTIVTALRKQNKLLGDHPNSMLYQQLSNYVNFDGYYLESNPCLVCNQPEVPFSMIKLASIKSETRYTTTHHIVKLVNSYEIQKVVIKITDIKRTKMIKKATLFYNNKKVPAIVELKNKKSLWNKAKTEHLSQGQSEIKFNLPLPIVATNLMLEFTDFFENVSVTTETLQCPRCSASVQASPGICGNCGENVFQCHKCRSINYDERDPYLCNVCGFSKFAKFDISLSAKPCCAVDTIDNDEDREKTILAVGSCLVKADSLYSQLIVKKPQLEELLLKTGKLSSFYSKDAKANIMGNKNTSSRAGNVDASRMPLGVPAVNSSVNKHITMLAQKYCQEVKSLFEQLSKIMRTVLAFRKEVLIYDERLKDAINSPDGVQKNNFEGDFTSADSCQSAPNCYGCAFSTSQHCLNLLRAFANNRLTCQKLVNKNVIPDLVEMNLRRGNAAQRLKVQNLICVLIKDNVEATSQLNNLLLEHIKASITYSHRNLISSSVATEMHMLVASMNIPDECWEIRLRSILYLFQLSLKLSSPSVIENITYPCIQLLQSKITASLGNVEKSNTLLSAEYSSDIMVDIQSWMKSDPNHSFEEWKKMKCLVSYPKKQLEGLSKEEVQNIFIQEKFYRKWQKFVFDKKLKMNKIGFTRLKHDWLKQTLFCKSSLAVRQAACSIVKSMAENPNHRAQIIELLTSYLSELSVGGESAFEVYELFEVLIAKKQWKIYVVARGILPYLGNLIEREINHLLELEASSMTLDLQQGYTLKYLTELLSGLVHVPYIQQRYKTSLISTVLNSYLNLRKLMIPRTVVVDDAQENLLVLLEDMTSGTETETRAFMAVCIETIKKHDLFDFKTPLFIFERLANIIVPETNNVNEFFVSLDKDPLQEDFLQGRMVGNPYASTDPGMGPLMRDVKNKICRDCDLVALLEDDYGMELLINNKIVSLDLAVRDVYNKIWVPTQVDDEPMKVVYRMRGLLGEATEDMVDSLDTEEDNRDEEEVYKLASVLSENQGIEVMLERLEVIKNLKHGRQLLDIILKLLSYTVHLKQNRKHLMKPELNMLNILLGTLNLGLQAGDEAVKLVEQLLGIMDRVLQEAAADEKKQVLKGDKKKLTLLLQQIDSETVQSHTNVLRGLMRIIPLLSFGDKDLMQMLIDHFSVTLDFEQYDKEHSAKDTLYLECFCEISTGIQNNTSGFQLKDLINKNGVVKNALVYIGKDVPQHKNFDSDDWKQFVTKPALTYVLRLLSGLCQNHAPTQMAIGDHPTCINDLHRLEQVSTQESIGSLAENVLEALKENETVAKLVDAVRNDTRAEKKRLAMEVRQRQLGALGMKTNEKGQVVTQSSILKQIGDLVEESGFTCIICREGYKFEPKKVLGIYTYTRRCSLEEFENSNRKMLGYTTVSHFNIVHYDCHTSAVRAARGREEWDSAMLQNANTKCNGLLPLWGPQVLESAFATCLARHNTYLQEATGYKEPNVQSTVHDLKHLLYRFASEKSFSEETGGGGKQSNIQLIPYIIHMAQYVINTTRSFSREDSTFVAFIQAEGKKWVESSYFVDGPLYCTTLALFIIDAQGWKKHKLLILKRLLVIAQARHFSKTTIKDLPNKEVLEYKIYKPYLMFWALVDLVYKVLFKKVPETDNDEQNWSVRLSDYIRHHDSELMDNSEKMLSSFQDEYLPIESLDEFMDVAELLGETEADVQSFVKNILNNLA